jgi:hypothetical protein
LYFPKGGYSISREVIYAPGNYWAARRARRAGHRDVQRPGALKVQTDNAWADMTFSSSRRPDPNLVETVKGYAGMKAR